MRQEVNYQEAVTEARQLVKRSEDDQWRLAQLTWEQMRQNGVTQRRWAQDIGIASDSYVGGMARAWERFGHLGAQRPGFAEAMRHVHKPGHAAEAEDLGSRHQADARQVVRNMPPERKAEIVRELIDDPDVSARIMRDPHTRANVVRAQRAAWDEQEQTAREQVKADPHLNAAQEAVLALSIENDLGMARWRVAEATRKRMELADSRTGQYADAVRQIEDVLSWFRTADDGGRVTDEALADLLAEGGGDQS